MDVSAEREKTDGWRERTGYESTDFSAKAGLTAVEKLDTSLSFTYSNSEYEMPGSLTEAQYEDDPKDAINKEDSSENIFTQVSISSLYELTDLSAVNLSLAFSNKENITDAESFWDNKYQNININHMKYHHLLMLKFQDYYGAVL